MMFVDGTSGDLELGQDPARVLVQQTARLGQLGPPSYLRDTGAPIAADSAHPVRDRRLTQVELRRDPGEALVVRHDLEDAQLGGASRATRTTSCGTPQRRDQPLFPFEISIAVIQAMH